MKQTAKFAAYGVAALLVLLVVAGVGAGILVSLDGNRLKGFVAERATGALGREVSIGGDFSVDLWSSTPRLVARDVVVDNADWGSRPEMATIGELAVRLRLKPLLSGRLVLEDVRVVEPDVLLETNGEQANWRFGEQDAEEGEREDLPVVRRLLVERGRIAYRAPQQDQPVDARIDQLEVKTASYEQPVEVRGTGSYKGQDVELHGQLGAFHTLREAETPYPVDLAGQVGPTRFSVDGGIRRPADLAGIDSQFTIEGESLAELHEWLELPLPDTAPYKLTGRLERQGRTWTLEEAQANLGDSDLAGTVAFHAEETPLRIVADVTSDKLLLRDLAPFFGGEKAEQAEKEDAEGKRLISDEPISLDKLQRMNADVHFVGRVVSRGPLDIQDLEAEVKLDGGRLTLDPLTFGLAEGEIRFTGRFDSTADVPRVAAGVDVTGIDLNALLSLLGVEGESAGLVRGRLDLEAKGGSLHEWAANAGGGGILVMEGGRIRNLLLEAVALDLQEALAQWASDDKTMARIRCLAMPLQVRDGRLVADPWLLDTTDALVEVRGFVDLGTEKVSLTLKPYPKDFSLFNTLTAITIEGDLAERTASVDPLEAAGKLALKTLAAPFMSVLSGEIEEEAKQRSPCGRLADEFRAAGPGDGDSRQPEQAEQR